MDRTADQSQGVSDLQRGGEAQKLHDEPEAEPALQQRQHSDHKDSGAESHKQAGKPDEKTGHAPEGEGDDGESEHLASQSAARSQGSAGTIDRRGAALQRRPGRVHFSHAGTISALVPPRERRLGERQAGS